MDFFTPHLRRLDFQVLRAQKGPLSSEERHAALQDLLKREEALRNDGNFEGLGELLKPLGRKMPAALALLIGPDLRTAAELRKSCAGQLWDSADYLTNYQASLGPNVAADLATRQEEEVEFLLKQQKTKMIVHYFVEVRAEYGLVIFSSVQVVLERKFEIPMHFSEAL